MVDSEVRPQQPFAVTVENSAAFFHHVIDAANLVIPIWESTRDNGHRDEMLSFTLLDTHLFRSEQTWIRIAKEEDKIYFRPQSKLIVVPEALAREDRGFYSDERITTLQKELEIQGLSSFIEPWDFPYQSLQEFKL